MVRPNRTPTSRQFHYVIHTTGPEKIMTNLHQGTPAKQSSLSGTAKSMIFENTSESKLGGINTATPADWDRVRKQHPAIEREENVYQPTHYTHKTGAECIDIMIQLYGKQRVEEWAEITAFKYQWRNGSKAGNSSEQDKMKSVWYTRFSMGDDPRDD